MSEEKTLLKWFDLVKRADDENCSLSVSEEGFHLLLRFTPEDHVTNTQQVEVNCESLHAVEVGIIMLENSI